MFESFLKNSKKSPEVSPSEGLSLDLLPPEQPISQRNTMQEAKAYENTGKNSSGLAGPITVITSGTEFKGEMNFDGELEIHGKFEGAIDSEGGKLTIGEEAIVKAEIRVREVIVYGIVQGNMTGTEKIDLRGKAQIYGDIRANRITVADGVVFVGQSQQLSRESRNKPNFDQIFQRLGKQKSLEASPSSKGASSAALVTNGTMKTTEKSEKSDHKTPSRVS